MSSYLFVPLDGRRSILEIVSLQDGIRTELLLYVYESFLQSLFLQQILLLVRLAEQLKLPCAPILTFPGQFVHGYVDSPDAQSLAGNVVVEFFQAFRQLSAR